MTYDVIFKSQRNVAGYRVSPLWAPIDAWNFDFKKNLRWRTDVDFKNLKLLLFLQERLDYRNKILQVTYGPTLNHIGRWKYTFLKYKKAAILKTRTHQKMR